MSLPNEQLSVELIKCCKDGEYDQIKMLLKSEKVNVNIQEHDTLSTPLHYTVLNDHIGITQILVANGANLNVRNAQLNTPMHLAVESDKLEMIELLIASGCDIELKNSDNKTPYDLAHSDDAKERLKPDSALYLRLKQTNLELIKVCCNGDIDRLREILAYPIFNINYQDSPKRQSALHRAAGGGYDNIVLLLLAAGAKVDLVDSEGLTTLHTACINGYVKIVELLIAAGANVDTQDANNCTSLHHASGKGYVEVVKLLLSATPQVNIQDKDSWTALTHAAAQGHTQVVSLLIEAKADVQLNDKHGKSPLYWATSNGHIETAEVLVTSGAKYPQIVNANQVEVEIVDVNENNGTKVDGEKEGANGHDIQIKQTLNPTAQLLQACKQSNHDRVSELLSQDGVDVNFQDASDLNRSSLHYASREGSVECVRLLLEGGADCRTRDEHQSTALHYAAASGHVKVLRLLLAEKNIDINAQDRNGDTPLHDAIQLNHIEVAEILLVEHCDVNVQNNVDWTALHCAASHKMVAMVKLLLAYGANINIVDKDNNRPIELIRSPSEIVSLLKDVRSDLVRATKDGDFDDLKELFRFDTENNVNYKDEAERSLLHFASWNGHIDIVQLLVMHQVDKDAQDKTLWTPLHYACFNNHEPVVEYLLSEGAAVNIQNEDGETPLYIACSEGYCGVVKLLLSDPRTDLVIANKDNRIPLEVASDGDVIALLKRATHNIRESPKNRPPLEPQYAPDIHCGVCNIM